MDINMLTESLVHGTETVEASNCGITPDMAGILQINNESAEDSFLLESAMILANARILSEGNEVEALQEGVVKNAFDRIKEIVKKMWAKIKEFFKGVRTFFDKIVMSSKSFAEKYETQIKAVKSVTIEGQDYKPENLKISNDIWKPASSYVTGSELADYNKTIKESEARDAMLSKITSDKNIKKFCLEKMNIKPAKTNVTFSGSELLSAMKEVNSSINTIKAEESEIDKLYSTALSEIEKAKKDAEGAKDNKEYNKNKARVAGIRASLIKDAMNQVNTATGLKIGAIKSMAGQAKTAAYKGIAQNKANAKKEDK